MTQTYFLKTFGCQANKSDSERIAGDYLARGYQLATSWRQADEIVINTCAVRQRAEDRVQGFLVNLDKYLLAHPRPRPKIILTGCMTHHGQAKLLKLLPQVDEILPIGEVGFNRGAVRRDQTHAWVPISTGCNSFCTFCIVPYARGRETSRRQADILSEVNDLASRGYTQITLLGQNVNSWGLEKTGTGLRKLYLNQKLSTADLPSNLSQYHQPNGQVPFVRLLQQISAIPNLTKISMMTNNPWDFYDQLIAEIATNPKIDRFIHLPVQSGSNKILKAMNRGYTRQNYLNLVQKIRTQIPDAILGTDIIVGFPGETDADFAATVDLANEVDFQVAFVAQYSPRPGTAAYKLYPDDVPPQVKKKRWQILDKLTNKKHLSHRPEIK